MTAFRDSPSPSEKPGASDRLKLLKNAGILGESGQPAARMKYVWRYVGLRMSNLRAVSDEDIVHELFTEILSDKSISDNAPATDPALLKWLWNRAQNIINRHRRAADERWRDDDASEEIDKRATEDHLLRLAEVESDLERLRKRLVTLAGSGDAKAVRDLAVLDNIGLKEDRPAFAKALRIEEDKINVRVAAFVRRARKFFRGSV